jgi:hypothetical protein
MLSSVRSRGIPSGCSKESIFSLANKPVGPPSRVGSDVTCSARRLVHLKCTMGVNDRTANMSIKMDEGGHGRRASWLS